MEENGRVRGCGGPVLAVAQDGSDGLVGACVEEQRARTGGIDAVWPVALDLSKNAASERPVDSEETGSKPQRAGNQLTERRQYAR